MSPDKLTYMANQIATFFDSQSGDRAEKVATHLRDFWEPGMRAQLLRIADDGGAGLSPLVMDATERLRADAARF